MITTAFTKIDRILGGMARTKPDYRTFKYSVIDNPVLTIGGNDIVEDVYPVTDVIYDMDDEMFYFWSGEACVYQSHESEHNEIADLLKTDI